MIMEYLLMSKTLIAIDAVNMPNLVKRTFARFMGWQYIYSEIYGGWILKRKVKGSIGADGWFHPYSYQSVHYSISWPYGQKL